MSGRLYRRCVPQSTSRALQRSQTLHSGRDVLEVTILPVCPAHIPASVVSWLTVLGLEVLLVKMGYFTSCW